MTVLDDVCALSWRLEGQATLVGEDTRFAESKYFQRDSHSLQRTQKMRPSYEKQIVLEELLPEGVGS